MKAENNQLLSEIASLKAQLEEKANNKDAAIME